MNDKQLEQRRIATKFGFLEVPRILLGKKMADKLNKQEVDMLREELEMLMNERTGLLKVVGAAAVLVANTDGRHLPPEAAEAAEMLSKCVNDLSEETLNDALETMHAKAGPGDL